MRWVSRKPKSNRRWNILKSKQNSCVIGWHYEVLTVSPPRVTFNPNHSIQAARLDRSIAPREVRKREAERVAAQPENNNSQFSYKMIRFDQVFAGHFPLLEGDSLTPPPFFPGLRKEKGWDEDEKQDC